MSDLNISQRMMDVVFSAVEEGLTTLKMGQHLVPFVLMLTKEGVILRRFDDDKTADALVRAQRAIADADDEALGYVLVYDGQIEVAGKDTDALLIEGAERSKIQGWRFVQRYQPTTTSTPLYQIGNLAYLGTADTYFVSKKEK